MLRRAMYCRKRCTCMKETLCWPLRRMQELFPQARITARRVTLAPPLARALVRVHLGLYDLLNSVPWLRMHILCWIKKP